MLLVVSQVEVRYIELESETCLVSAETSSAIHVLPKTSGLHLTKLGYFQPQRSKGIICIERSRTFYKITSIQAIQYKVTMICGAKQSRQMSHLEARIQKQRVSEIRVTTIYYQWTIFRIFNSASKLSTIFQNCIVYCAAFGQITAHKMYLEIYCREIRCTFQPLVETVLDFQKADIKSFFSHGST